MRFFTRHQQISENLKINGIKIEITIGLLLGGNSSSCVSTNQIAGSSSGQQSHFVGILGSQPTNQNFAPALQPTTGISPQQFQQYSSIGPNPSLPAAFGSPSVDTLMMHTTPIQQPSSA